MPSRPLVWLTISFMLGISADHLFGESLPIPTHYFAFASLMLIAAMVISLWPRNRFANWFRLPSSVLRTFAIPALLFFIFGMWASKASAPQFPQALQPFLNGLPSTYVAEVSTSTTVRPTYRKLVYSGFSHSCPINIKQYPVLTIIKQALPSSRLLISYHTPNATADTTGRLPT